MVHSMCLSSSPVTRGRSSSAERIVDRRKVTRCEEGLQFDHRYLHARSPAPTRGCNSQQGVQAYYNPAGKNE